MVNSPPTFPKSTIVGVFFFFFFGSFHDEKNKQPKIIAIWRFTRDAQNAMLIHITGTCCPFVATHAERGVVGGEGLFKNKEGGR